ncbi:MAG: hypothetical protein GC137_04315 [Alphaproteobacteria bacterium]|nr:hypothetical protein [Alphaproteobacteria bacterium]
MINEFKKREDGNVLFLILIAVALFAALSYAVTSSTRTGGGDASSETNLINSAQITQYPAAVSTAIVRMIISGTSISEMRFNSPSEFSDLDSNGIGVFHPQGGAANFISSPASVMNDNALGEWVFNAELEVPDIGVAGAGGNEVIAFLEGIKESICSKINEEYGLGSSIPVLSADLSTEYRTRMFDDGSSDYVFPTGDVPDIDDGSNTFDGQPFGCFQNNGGGANDYVYYHVVVER